jgi:hypothetical protein
LNKTGAEHTISSIQYNTNTDKNFVIFHCQTVILKLGKRFGLSASNGQIEIFAIHW